MALMEDLDRHVANVGPNGGLGDVPGHSLVHKFGAGELDTTIHPITQGQLYQTPTAATALEIISASVNDTAAGSGAQQVTLVGLDANWDEVTQTVEMNGTTAVALTTPLIRLYRWYVSRSGTYATATAGSHAEVLTVRVAGAGATWDTIAKLPFPLGQSQIGVYTVPRNKKAYLLSKNIFVDSTKAADIYFFQRPNASDVVTPYTGTMRLAEREVGLTGGYNLMTQAPKGPFIGPCDIGFMGLISVGTAECSVEFELLLVDD